MIKVPPDDIVEGLYKLRIRESEKLKTVLELYDLEIHQKKLGPNYHWLKTMVKRDIEQDIRNKNFGARNGSCEKNAVVKNQGTKQRVQRILGDCWQWETNGQCVKGNIAVSATIPISVEKLHHQIRLRILSCGRVSENHREPEVPGEGVPVVEMYRWPCKDYFKGTCNNSFCEKWHPPECLFYKTKSGCRFGEKCSYAHRQVDEQPNRRSKKNDDKSAVAMLKKNDWHENVRKLVVNHGKWRQIGATW